MDPAGMVPPVPFCSLVSTQNYVDWFPSSVSLPIADRDAGDLAHLLFSDSYVAYVDLQIVYCSPYLLVRNLAFFRLSALASDFMFVAGTVSDQGRGVNEFGSS